MADIKVCDRCGKKLTDERTSFTLKPVPPSRYILSAKVFKRVQSCWWNDNSGTKTVNTEHDLCPECTLELSKWLEHESKEETDGV